MYERYFSRLAAASALAQALGRYRDQEALVLAIPRGAVPMGRALADALRADLDIVLVRKLGAPGNPELAVGAIDETGWSYVSDIAASVGASPEYLRREQQRQLELLRSRRAMYTPSRAPLDPGGRIAIVVDDGLATGATMIAALHAVRSRNPSRLVCAVPVAPVESLRQVRPHADELVCLQTPRDFYAVGQFYEEFRQVEDDEVIAALGERPRSASAEAGA